MNTKVASTSLPSIHDILVPYDFSDPADRALQLAVGLALKFDARLTVIHANWLPAWAYPAYAEGWVWPVDEMEAGARMRLDDVLGRLGDVRVPVLGVVVTREPSQAILEAIEERRADLVVMGTHGRTGLARLLLGSVAEKTVRLSTVPVLTTGAGIRTDARADSRDATDLRASVDAADTDNATSDAKHEARCAR